MKRNHENEILKAAHERIEELTEQLHEAYREIRYIKAHPPETIRRIITETKPAPRPQWGWGELLDKAGYPAYRFATRIELPDTNISFPPVLEFEPIALRIRWEI